MRGIRFKKTLDLVPAKSHRGYCSCGRMRQLQPDVTPTLGGLTVQHYAGADDARRMENRLTRSLIAGEAGCCQEGKASSGDKRTFQLKELSPIERASWCLDYLDVPGRHGRFRPPFSSQVLLGANNVLLRSQSRRKTLLSLFRYQFVLTHFELQVVTVGHLTEITHCRYRSTCDREPPPLKWELGE